MSSTLLSRSDLREIQRAFYGELRASGIPVTYVTVSDGGDAYLEVGVEEPANQMIPSAYQGVRVQTRAARRAVLALGDRDGFSG